MAKARKVETTIKLTNLRAQLPSVNAAFLAELTSDEIKFIMREAQRINELAQSELKRAINR